MPANLGRLLILLGLVFIALGFIFIWGVKIPGLGRLPGDIYLQRKNFTFYFPLASCILISIILTLILWLIKHK